MLQICVIFVSPPYPYSEPQKLRWISFTSQFILLSLQLHIFWECSHWTRKIQRHLFSCSSARTTCSMSEMELASTLVPFLPLFLWYRLPAIGYLFCACQVLKVQLVWVMRSVMSWHVSCSCPHYRISDHTHFCLHNRVPHTCALITEILLDCVVKKKNCMSQLPMFTSVKHFFLDYMKPSQGSTTVV